MSDNSRFRAYYERAADDGRDARALQSQPQPTALEDGLRHTYAWIEQQVVSRLDSGGIDEVEREELIRAD